MITPEEKAKHLIDLYKGNYSLALSHAKDCLEHCDSDGEPAEVKELFKSVVEILSKKLV